jgi:protein involved in ribonucleotide reduction
LNYETLYNSIQAYAENTEQLFVANIPVFVQEAEDRIYNSVNLPSLRKNVTGTLTAGNQYISLPDDWLANYSLAVIDSNNKYNYLLNKDVNYLREAYPTVVYTSPTYQGTPGGVPAYHALFGSQLSNVNEMTLMVAPTPDDNYTVEMHYFYYPPTIVQGQIATLGAITAGSLYTNGVYQNVALTGGSGANATADIVISGGVVTSVNLRFGGNFYVAGDILSCSSLGSTGSGFSIPVSSVSNSKGTSWLGDNYDPVLFYGAMREALIFMKGEADMVSYYEKMYQEALQQLARLGDGLDRGDFYRNGQLKLNLSGARS